ncbi:GNAT family N-acetyltransferase [Bacillus testis]|uniref:GNAT family N-acetyltransferase n=1 Tax=Bacillus testis TaxID=1622072 RepID=UPI00067F29B7|nr:GNAT family N-acetyltransferase [Bacillus testis]
MITFEPLTEQTLFIAKEIVHSNADYNLLEHGKAERSEAEIAKEFLEGRDSHAFIKADDTYIGLISFLDINPKDSCPWIGLFMIHKDYQGYGYGTQAYFQFEEEWRQQGKEKIRLGVLVNNTAGKRFWEGLGYLRYQTASVNGKSVDCYEKAL